MLKIKGRGSKDKLLGSLVGFAIGDSMGATTEFMSSEEIKEKYGEVNDLIGGGWLNLKSGEVTDDTQMMLCIIEAIYSSNTLEDFKENCMDNFSEWLKTTKDVGNGCRKAIINWNANRTYTGKNKEEGNGGIMRCLPFALLIDTRANIEQLKLTHNNHIVERSLVMYLNQMYYFLNDKGSCYISNELQPPLGHSVNTVHNSIYWSNSETFREGIIGAVNHGGDADTIAALSGSLLGAKFGYENIPKEWIDKLDPKVMKELLNFYDYICSDSYRFFS